MRVLLHEDQPAKAEVETVVDRTETSTDSEADSAIGDAASNRATALSLALAAVTLALVHWSPPPPDRCAGTEQPMLQAQIFLGRNIGTRPGVSDIQFQRFVARELTPRFPAGLTVSGAIGQWRGPDAAIVQEKANVVTLLVADNEASRSALEDARRVYMARFRQRSVLVAHQPVCTRI